MLVTINSKIAFTPIMNSSLGQIFQHTLHAKVLSCLFHSTLVTPVSVDHWLDAVHVLK